MDNQSSQITHDFAPFFRVYETGRIERYLEVDFLPPLEDPKTGVISKDVISPENHFSARIYLPRADKSGSKFPLIIYVHGGAFSIESAFSSLYHNYVNSLAAESQSVVVSVEYRLAPEHPVPACYEDCWMATKWVESHSRIAQGPDAWLTEYVDFKRVFLAGDSAGANIVHEMVVRAGVEDEFNIKFAGLMLIHPFFGSGSTDKLWDFICPETTGLNDSRLNPAVHPNILSNLHCDKVLVCIAENDFLKTRGATYHEALKNSDFKGVIELFETPGEGHVFHLFNPTGKNAASMMKLIVKFMDRTIASPVL